MPKCPYIRACPYKYGRLLHTAEGGFPYSHITLSQNVNIFVKTKNAQEALKHKINLKIFFVTWAFPYWGGGGGSDNVGKIPTFYRFLFWRASLRGAFKYFFLKNLVLCINWVDPPQPPTPPRRLGHQSKKK